jgi:predicted nucleotidyltransferase
METISHIKDAIHTIAVNNGAYKAILFGSYARGTATRHSDIDIVFIEDTTEPFLKRMDKYLYPLLDMLGEPVEVMVYTPDEFSRMQGGPFMKRILDEGMVIYEQ